MDDKAFKERVARLKQVAEIVEKLPSEVRSQAFAALEPYVTGEAATPVRKPKTKTVAEQPDDDENDDTHEAFFQTHNHTDPADNVRLIAAYLYREYGTAPFTVKEVKKLADDVGLTVPERIDMTLRQAREASKNLFSSPSRGLFKPTVHGEAALKKKYSVTKGRKSKSTTEDPATE